MSHKCAICNLVFGQYFLYTMHMDLDHQFHQPLSKKATESKIHTKEELRQIAYRVETRLGSHNFFNGVK